MLRRVTADVAAIGRSTAPTRQQATKAAAPAAAAGKAAADGGKAKQKVKLLDGNEAASYVAYALSDMAFIYPITPSSPMGENADDWMMQKRPNVFGQIVRVTEMQSEAGAAGSLHGAIVAGAMTTTFTASQGLLLMIPNMYKLAGELWPCVFHVAARALAGQGLSIFGDHSDVMAVRQTGFALLSSHSVQEAHDLAVVSHIASLNASLPFLHFFDGFRTSHEVAKAHLLPNEELIKMLPLDKVAEFRARAMNPNRPSMRGTSQPPEIFFQMVEAANPYYEKVPGIVEAAMQLFAEKTGRQYKLFDYYGSPDAESVIVMMGCGTQIVEEAIDVLRKKGEKVGLIKVRLYRPWKEDAFKAVLPKSVKNIVVMDRTKESGSLAEPLYLDVAATIQKDAALRSLPIFGGRYGLGSKDFTPAMAAAIYTNAKQPAPKNNFTVGINDDVSHLSIPVDEKFVAETDGTTEIILWGLGSDGTVGASKDAIKIIGEATPMYAQGYFAYDAKKSGGVTQSHLRFGPNPIKSSYLVTKANYVACHSAPYLWKYDMLSAVQEGGTFLLNSAWATTAEMEANLPGSVKRMIAQKKLKFYNVDAYGLAAKLGLGRLINQVCQAAFFKLSGVMPFEQSLELLKKSIVKTYSRKGDAVVKKNISAVESGVSALTEIKYPASWANAALEEKKPMGGPGSDPFVDKVMAPMLALQGDKLPVSAFVPGGVVPSGTARYEKRMIALEVPVWDNTKCTQCNWCSIVCPHAAIRPFLMSDNEVKAAPNKLTTLKAKGSSKMAEFRFRIQVSPLDCTGCEVCVRTCPDDALSMKPVNDVKDEESVRFDYCVKLPNRAHLVGESVTFKDSQFAEPLLEFSGACAGCGETPYVKLLTQLFGDRLVVANATGCSSIWAGSHPSNPYTKNQKGMGPAWGNSLFEDAAEYGFGMATATLSRRAHLREDVAALLAVADAPLSIKLRALLKQWYDGSGGTGAEAEDPHRIGQLASELVPLLEAETKAGAPDALTKVHASRDLFVKVTNWCIGGDGWAYDIGYGGLDHVLASGERVRILVLDTEMYSNTGGQASKSTPLGAIARFASSGKGRSKKDLGTIAMAYEDVFVASISLAANPQQAVNALRQAESYDGVSIVLAYSPCISHGLSGGMARMAETMRLAVDTGYWSLYTRDPRRRAKGEPAFQLESRKVKLDLQRFLEKENRFLQLHKQDETKAAAFDKRHALASKERFELFARRSMSDDALYEQLRAAHGIDDDKDKVYVLYGSETGNAEGCARHLFRECGRRGLNVRLLAMEDASLAQLGKAKIVLNVVSTCGQGEIPSNARAWYETLKAELPTGSLPDAPGVCLGGDGKVCSPSPSKLAKAGDAQPFANVKYAMFGLGDSSYCYYQAAALMFDAAYQKLGAKPMLPMGKGDDQDADRYETGWEEWLPDLFTEIGAPLKDPDAMVPPTHMVRVEPECPTTLEETAKIGLYSPPGTTQLPLVEGRLTSTPERDIWHYVFDLSGTAHGAERQMLEYGLGSCMAIHSHNRKEDVERALEYYRLSGDQLVTIRPVAASSTRSALPEKTTARKLFSEVLDLFGKPGQRFYDQLRLFASGSERADLARLSSKAGRDEVRANREETLTFFDVMKRYPSATPPLEALVDMVPVIKPRLYSIASSNFMHPTQLHLAVMTVDWSTPTGRKRHGLCTNYLKNLILDKEDKPNVVMSIKPAVVNFPEDPMVPQVMVGLGTGIAPFRAMIEFRAQLRRNGTMTGPMAFFMGVQSKKKDYLYGEEWEAYRSEGKPPILTEENTAFSRDQAKKIYVQDKLAESNTLYKYLIQEKGYFYLCGPSRNVPEQVRKGVFASWKRTQNIDDKQCEALFMEMKLAGRWNEETWS